MKSRSLLQKIKDWWPLYGIVGTVCGLIILWGNIPNRMNKVEAGQVEQQDKLTDLQLWARELQGYTRAQEQMNRQQQVYQQQQQYAPNKAAPGWSPPQRPTDDLPRVWWEQDEQGYWYCTDGQDSWWPDAAERCE